MKFLILLTFFTQFLSTRSCGHEDVMHLIPSEKEMSSYPTFKRPKHRIVRDIYSFTPTWTPIRFETIYHNSILRCKTQQVHSFLAEDFFGVDEINMACDEEKKSRGIHSFGLDGDFILFVVSSPLHCKPGSIAYALHLSVSSFDRRPTSGIINLCSEQFRKRTPLDDASWFSTVLHEITHALVFSSSLYNHYIDPNTMKPLGKNNVLMVVDRRWKTLHKYVDHRVVMMVTPEVRRVTREFIGCDSLEGAELEDYGSSGTRGTHWEKRVFENEAMTGVATDSNVYSDLTVALFMDSGWYKPIDNVTIYVNERMYWGHNAGCKFAKGSCQEFLDKKDPYPFCKKRVESRCSGDRKSTLFCQAEKSFIQNTTVYPHFEYSHYYDFAAIDFCPYYRKSFGANRNADCTDLNNEPDYPVTFEVYSPTSRCFEVKDGFNWWRGFRKSSVEQTIGCYEHRCFPLYPNSTHNVLHVKTAVSKWLPCYETGQKLYYAKWRGRDVIKFEISCPPCSELCDNCDPNLRAPDYKIGDFNLQLNCIIESKVVGHWYMPYLHEFTDAELGIPPDSAPDPEYWGHHKEKYGTYR